MRPAVWVKRFVFVAALVFLVLTAVELAKGHAVESALGFAALWALVAAGIFTVTGIYRARRGQYCAICQDTPEPK